MKQTIIFPIFLFLFTFILPSDCYGKQVRMNLQVSSNSRIFPPVEKRKKHKKRIHKKQFRKKHPREFRKQNKLRTGGITMIIIGSLSLMLFVPLLFFTLYISIYAIFMGVIFGILAALHLAGGILLIFWGSKMIKKT